MTSAVRPEAEARLEKLTAAEEAGDENSSGAGAGGPATAALQAEVRKLKDELRKATEEIEQRPLRQDVVVVMRKAATKTDVAALAKIARTAAWIKTGTDENVGRFDKEARKVAAKYGRRMSTLSAEEATTNETFFIQQPDHTAFSHTNHKLITKYFAGWLCKYQQLAVHKYTCIVLVATWFACLLLTFLIFHVPGQKKYFAVLLHGDRIVLGTLAITTVCVLAHFFVVSKFRPYTWWSREHHNDFNYLSQQRVTARAKRQSIKKPSIMVQRINLLWNQIYARNVDTMDVNLNFKELLKGEKRLKPNTDEKWLNPNAANAFVAVVFAIQVGFLFLMPYNAVVRYLQPTSFTHTWYNSTTGIVIKTRFPMPTMSFSEVTQQALLGVSAFCGLFASLGRARRRIPSLVFCHCCMCVHPA